jgi:hypothetical protein
MGKLHKSARRFNHANQHSIVGQHDVGDGPNTAERGSLCAVADIDRSGTVADTPAGHDQDRGDGGPECDSISERAGELRGVDVERIGIAGRAPCEVTRSFDAAEINKILNDPDVFPFVSVPGMESIDVTELVADPRNVLLMAKGGGLIFCWHEPGVYEVHNNFLTEFRDWSSAAAAQSAIKWMFTHTDCMSILTRVPAFNKAARHAAMRAGGHLEFERKACWPTKDGMCDMSFFALRYDDWIRQTPSIALRGREFHKKIDEEFARHGAERTAHPDEDCHDLYAGICAEMLLSGQPDKAVALYNRWARFAGYGMIGLLARDPLMIDLGDCLIQVIDGNFKVIKCRPPQQPQSGN